MTSTKNRSLLICFLVLSYFTLINCVIEIPFKAIRKKGMLKNKNFRGNEPTEPLRSLVTIYQEADLKISERYYFLAEVNIGSNQKKFNLTLNTFSNEFCVVSSAATNINVKNKYNPRSSTTANNTKETFSYGNIKGSYYTDEIYFLEDKFQMKFAVVTEGDLNFIDTDGVIGLGHSYKDEQLSFIHMLKYYNITNSKVFSFKFENGIKVGSTGKFYIGKHEDFSSDKSITCPLSKFNGSDAYWYLKVNGFSLKIGNKELKSSKKFNFNLNTAYQVVLPMDYLNDIEKNLSDFNCTTYQDNKYPDYYQLKCSLTNGTLPDFKFKINGYVLTVPFNYTFEFHIVHYYSNVFFSKLNETTLGAQFFFPFHTLFDSENETIQFYSNNTKLIEKDNDPDNKEDEDGKGGKDDKDEKGDKDGKGEGEDKKGGIKLWMIIAGAAALVVLIVVLIIIICCCCCKSKKDQEDEEVEKGVDSTEPILENQNQ